jgi:hypothetical protein
MAETIKVLAQSNPGAAVLTDIYTVPALTSTVVSSVVVCNESSTPSTFRIAIAVGGAADDPKQYLYFDLSFPGNETFIATIGITLAAGDIIRVRAGTGNFAFTVLGEELS